MLACADTQVYVDATCEKNPQTGKRDYSVAVGVSRSFSAAPPVRAQCALLVPTTWSGFTTTTKNKNGTPFVHNGTTLSWSASGSVAAKAEALGPTHSPTFAWVGFETNQYTPDPNITFLEFVQLIGIASAPDADLGGAVSLQVFSGDYNQQNDRIQSMPSSCPMSLHLGSHPSLPALPILGTVALLVLMLAVAARTLSQRQRHSTV
jgi:hypothetical protein